VEPLLDDEEDKPQMVKGRTVDAEPHVALTQEEGTRLLAACAGTSADGEALQIARFKALAADPRVKGKEGFALRLATEAPSMSAEAVAALCADIPTSPPQRLSLEERARETGADAISSAPMPAHDRTKAGWDDAIAKTNARTLAEVPRRR
jgi:hypothetical protein